MSKLFGLNKPNTNLRKNVFDLSEKRLFSSSVGMLLPCMVKECNPGEKFQINLGAITRTQPLNTSAFVRIRQYYHFFFVPFKQLWSGWDNFINNVDYRTSSVQQPASNYTQVPTMSLVSYIRKLVKDRRLCGLPSEFSKYLESLNSTTGFMEEALHNIDVANELYKQVLNASSGYKDKAFDEHGYLYGLGVSRLMDMLGYGFNVDGINTFSEWLNKYASAYSTVNSDFTSLDHPSSASRLNSFEYLSFNMFRFLAYQKIYNDFYKRDDYEKTNPLAWNIDDLHDKNGFDNLDSERLLEMTRLRYRWSAKDYFTGVVPSELYGLSTSLKGFFDTQNNLLYREDYMNVTDNSAISISPNDVSTKSIRTAFAIEKLMRLTRRAGGFDYISQTAAHYGFEPPKGRGDKVEFIGGFTNNIDISEVITQSSFAGQVNGNTVGNGVGQIFGKGFGSCGNNKEIEFTAKEHGLIMCITSAVPDLDYDASGIDRFNTKYKRGDYFHPEFQDLGLQPVFGYELDGSKDVRGSVLGFNPMYSEYKVSFDRLHGEFRNGRSMSAWSASSLLSSKNLNSHYGLNLSTLKINPKCLDRIFSIDYNGMEYSDQLMTSAQFIVKSIRPMSVTGQNL